MPMRTFKFMLFVVVLKNIPKLLFKESLYESPVFVDNDTSSLWKFTVALELNVMSSVTLNEVCGVKEIESLSTFVFIPTEYLPKHTV